MLLRPLEGEGKRWGDWRCPSPPRTYLTARLSVALAETCVSAGPQAAQAHLPEAWVLTLVLSLSPKPLSQHIPEAAKQTPLPHGPPFFPHSCQGNYSGWSRKAGCPVGMDTLHQCLGMYCSWHWWHGQWWWWGREGGGCWRSFEHLGRELPGSCRVPAWTGLPCGLCLIPACFPHI